MRLRRERGWTAAAALPAAAVLAAALAAEWTGDRSRFPCPLYPDASVTLGSALRGDCTLTYGDRIHAIETGDGVHVIESADELQAVVRQGPADWTLRLSPDPRTAAVVPASDDAADEIWARLMAAFALCGALVAIVRLTRFPR